MAIRDDDDLRYVPLTSAAPPPESSAQDPTGDLPGAVPSDEWAPASDLEFDMTPHAARGEPCALCGVATSPPETVCQSCGAMLTWPVYRASEVMADDEIAEPMEEWPPDAIALGSDVPVEPQTDPHASTDISAPSPADLASAPTIRRRSRAGGYHWLDAIAVLGSVMIIAGSTMVWDRAEFITVRGTDGDGAITLAGGIIIAVLVLLRAQVGRFIGLVVAFLVLADVAYVGVSLDRAGGDGLFGLRVGEGIYLVGVGAALAAIAIIIRMSMHRSS